MHVSDNVTGATTDNRPCLLEWHIGRRTGLPRGCYGSSSSPRKGHHLKPSPSSEVEPSTCAELLGSDGTFSRVLPDFMPRAGQQEMAAQIERVLGGNGMLVAESGTGTGKTFAYLVPAVLSGKKVLISTGTRNLQDQLFNRDLPVVREVLNVPFAAALLKGRSNYLCLHRLENLAGSESTRRHMDELARVTYWARATRAGDIAEMSEIPEDSDLWPLVTSTADNCLGGSCPRYSECFVNRARREALAADVLVVNHHLFFADLALREEGFGQLLPGVEALIFDEAHQLPEVAANFFGQSINSYQLIGLARDAITEELKEKSGVAALRPAAQALEKAVADFRLAFGTQPRRDAWGEASDERALHDALSELRARLADLGRALELAAPCGEGLAHGARRAGELLERLFLIADEPPPDYVPWFETTARGFSLRLTPLEVSAPLRAHLAADRAWVFVSATLSVNGDFAHFQSRLGLEHAETARWESPFDYARQALLYLPPDMPQPSAPHYTEHVIEAALPVLAASGGRAFLLFTSHRALRRALELLADQLPYPILVQGSLPRAQLLERFRALGNAVLLGTGSFWEGVDVRGEALSCVIIDKLPFATPDDPVLRARATALEEAGRNPFMEYQLPEAVIALKQGVGRLIRDERDRGVLVLCDPRLRNKSYGRVFLQSLPPIPRTTLLADVQAFFSPE